MAYNHTARAPGKSAMRPKNRVWGFSANGRVYPLGNRRRRPEPRRKSSPTPTFLTPGIPQWPSRDPIEEEGGVALYGFVYNSPVNAFDLFGKATVSVGEELYATLSESDCCYNEYGFEAEKVADDFNRKCCPNVIKISGVELWYQNTIFKTITLPVSLGIGLPAGVMHVVVGVERSGHAAIKTPNVFKGFYPRGGVTKHRTVADGVVRNENDVDPAREWTGSKSYKACPASIEKVEELLEKYNEYFSNPARDQGTAYRPNPFGGADGCSFNLEGGVGGRNCLTFASMIIEEAGGRPPVPVLEPVKSIKF